MRESKRSATAPATPIISTDGSANAAISSAMPSVSPALVVHPQGQRDHRERVTDVGQRAGRDHQPQVAVPPQRGPARLTREREADEPFAKDLLHKL